MLKDERFEVENEDAQRALRTLATLIQEQVPDGMGFGLFLWDFGEGGAMFWISNTNRKDAVASIKEWIAKEERKFAPAVRSL